MNIIPLINITLRASTMLSRFLLMFVIAKYLPDADMGLYGLLTITIVFSLYAVGLDFYIYSTRELIKKKRNEWGELLKSQFMLVGILYAIYIPLLSLAFLTGLLPWTFFPYLIGILFLEHFCQECQRIIIADQKPLAANVGLFIRNGLWPFVFILLIFYNVISHSLLSVLIAWIIGDLLAAIFFISIIHSMHISGWSNHVNWKWLFSGVKICVVFLIGTLALRFNSVIERYWLQDLASLEIVGVYAFFLGVSGVLTNFLDAGVIAFKYPKLIKAHSENNIDEYKKVKKELIFQVCFWTFLLTVISLVMINFILGVIGKPIYFEYKNIYYFTLLSTVISCISLLPHYELYARNKDKYIVISHVASLGVFFLLTILLQFYDKIYAIPMAVFLSQAFILLFKYYFNQRVNKNEHSYIN